MSISVRTPAPTILLDSLKKKIEDRSITLWLCDSAGDFTLNSEEFKNKAWLRPFQRGDVLAFGLIGQKDVKMTKRIYAIYHAKFLETLLISFDEDFVSAVISSAADNVDYFK